MDTVVYQITAEDLEQIIEAVFISVFILFMVFRVGGFLIDWVDRLLLTKTISKLETKRDFLLSEIGSLERQKSSLDKG